MRPVRISGEGFARRGILRISDRALTTGVAP
jgi:hypothetical protein